MDDKYGRKGRVPIFDVNGNSFAVELLKIWVTRVVDEHEGAGLRPMNAAQSEDEPNLPRA